MWRDMFLAFDIGGVFYRGWPEAAFWPRWAGRTGLKPEAIEAFLTSDPDAVAARLGRISGADYYARAAERLHVDAAILQQMAEEAYLSDFDEALASFVRELRAGGRPVAALTNSLSTERQLMGRPTLSGLFDLVVSSADVGAAKPEAPIFHALLKRLGARPADILFVDDTKAHVEAAAALGFRTIHFSDRETVVAEIRRLLDYDG